MASRLQWIHFGRVDFYPASLFAHIDHTRLPLSTVPPAEGLEMAWARAVTLRLKSFSSARLTFRRFSLRRSTKLSRPSFWPASPIGATGRPTT